jgi:hypothetical protein
MHVAPSVIQIVVVPTGVSPVRDSLSIVGGS